MFFQWFQLPPPVDSYSLQGVRIDPTTKEVTILPDRLTSVKTRTVGKHGYQVPLYFSKLGFLD